MHSAKDIGSFREQEKEEIEKMKTQCDGNSQLQEINWLCLTKKVATENRNKLVVYK